MTTDLLSVWTDPDTAIDAVGTSISVVRSSAPPKRDECYDVLLDLVERGDLEKRACADGRYAFRWRDSADRTAVSTAVESVRLAACLASMARPSLFTDHAAARPEDVATTRRSAWPRVVAVTAPLVLPALSCVLALLAFVLLGRDAGIAVAGVLALPGVVGLVRRVPLAGFWTIGVVVAGVVLRLS